VLRKAAVKGIFYPESPVELDSYFENYLDKSAGDDCIFAVLPHAGYVYSGETALLTLNEIKVKDNVILMGPNHTGLGSRISVYPGGSWDTPYGLADVNEEIADYLTDGNFFQKDTAAHIREHSLEVIIPMLMYKNPEVKINPITISRLNIKECRLAAEKLFQVIGDRDDVTLIISSDMNHFENADRTEEKDMIALRKVLDMDEEGLINEVIKNDISMCGVIPTAIAIVYAKLKKYSETRLIMHTHSGHTSGDYDKCVGYAGIVIK